MKKQSGFTLIELLLVLAIIGIISAIAIPALLSQRARARDKASIENMVGAVNDLVGQYDKMKEAGSTTFATGLTNYLINNHANDKNPWNPSIAAYGAGCVASVGSTYDTVSTFSTNQLNTVPTNNGSLYFKLALPSAGHPGYLGGAVKVGNLIDNSYVVRKATAIE
jgi:type IV pilus assembly protein PilA